MSVFRRKSSVMVAGGVVFLVLCLLGGCGVSNIGTHFSSALLNQDDPQVVATAAPAYLLLMDSLVAASPENSDRLRSAANLYTLYAATFVDSPVRAKRLSVHAFDYGQRALCAQDRDGCALANQPYATFEERLQKLAKGDVPELFAFTASWLVWAQAHREDWNVVAAVPKLELALQRLLELDESYENGRSWLYLGILSSLKPPSLGGKPEQARSCFERALLTSSGKDLGVKVAYARYYARLVYDRELHDRLLYEVINADVYVENLTLMNTLAQAEARQLLKSGEDYF